MSPKFPAFPLLLALAACGSAAEAPPPAPSPAEATPALPAAGKRFDPPVDKSEIPDGAWMCDMGTVHYAAGHEGDGKCPVCGMKLTKK